jgi:hypothetical protein
MHWVSRPWVDFFVCNKELRNTYYFENTWMVNSLSHPPCVEIFITVVEASVPPPVFSLTLSQPRCRCICTGRGWKDRGSRACFIGKLIDALTKRCRDMIGSAAGKGSVRNGEVSWMQPMKVMLLKEHEKEKELSCEVLKKRRWEDKKGSVRSVATSELY